MCEITMKTVVVSDLGSQESRRRVGCDETHDQVLSNV